MKYSKKEMIALKKALSIVFNEISDDDVRHYSDCGYLTLNKGKDGKEYAWYLDGDGFESCVSVESLSELTKKEIAEQFS